MGIFAVQARAVEDQTARVQAAIQSESATPTSTLANTPALFSTATGSTPTEFSLISAPSHIDIYAFIQAPTRQVLRPYVKLIAFASLVRKGLVQIRGFINSDQFVCPDAPCIVYLKSDSRLVFRAYAETGEVSDEIIASVSITQGTSGYHVTLDTVSQYTKFADACSRIWGKRDENNVTWDDFAQFPYQLNTNKTLHTLAVKLILSGRVDVSSCPTGGLSLGLNWPTACGLDKATNLMIAWQNQFDEYIWLASRDHGVPPKIMKSLIEYESQFWPGNSRFYIDEIGLGQVNQLGVDVLLRQDPTYYQKVCNGISDCTTPYISLSPNLQAKIRGAVMTLMNASCADCEYGVNLDTAKQSVDLVSSLVLANCQQVDKILKQPYKIDKTPAAATATAAVATLRSGGQVGPSFEDMWRFTLLAYHSGIVCFQQAVDSTRQNGEDMTWQYLRENLNCKGARDYVDGLMNNLQTFDNYLYDGDVLLENYPNPTLVPTNTPIPSPTAYISTAKIIVKVYIDKNGNNVPDDGEWIDAMTVQVLVSNSQKITQRTQNGIATFDMNGYTPDSAIEVSLPGLYRSEVFKLPIQGERTVIFKFDQPALPTILP